MPAKTPKRRKAPSKKGDKGRTPAESLEMQLRQEKAITLYLMGVKQGVIAKRLGVSQATISSDIATMRDQINERAAAKSVELQAEEIAKIDAVEAAAWQSFFASKKRGRLAQAGGNPRFLDIVLDCSDRRRKILGLDKQMSSGAQGLLEFLAQNYQEAETTMPERKGPRPLFGKTNGEA
jgi:predicted transcriptional regulator